MAPVLYYLLASPAVRAVLMTAKTIELDLDLKEVDLLGKEHLTPWYRKLNPQHTVPTLVDEDNFTIWDSHAIMPYIISKYAKDDSLYPIDLQKRAIIDQRLHFDSALAFGHLYTIMKNVISYKNPIITQAQVDSIHQVYEFLEIFLENRQWIAGDTVTIADYSLVSSVTSLRVLAVIDEKKYPRVCAWLKKAEEWPVYDLNSKGLKEFEDIVRVLFDKLPQL